MPPPPVPLLDANALLRNLDVLPSLLILLLLELAFDLSPVPWALHAGAGLLRHSARALGPCPGPTPP